MRDTLGLAPLPVEGGLYARTYADEHSSAILYLLAEGDVSALHVLDGPEVYHFHAGHPLQLVLVHPDGRTEEPVLGSDLGAGQRPQVVVPAGVWQGSTSLGPWTLVGTTMAPPYADDRVRFADAGSPAGCRSAAERLAGLAQRWRATTEDGPWTGSA